MILEQALFYLPEILTGNGYPRQRYEGGIVAAFSLALLQSLNGRNISNPISCLQTERPFRGTEGWPRGETTKRRYLRSDLYLNTEKTEVVSERLLNYGWRSRNWVEAKFFRESTKNPQQNTANLLADLLRLLALVPNHMEGNSENRRINTGRFLLHVYESFDPKTYLSINRRTGVENGPRRWLHPLINGGVASCKVLKLGDCETGGIMKALNTNLKDVSFSFTATSWRIGPVFDAKNVRQYVCILTRIDSFSVAREDVALRVTQDRRVTYKPDHRTFVSKLREHVGRWINLKPGSETKQPELGEATRIAVEDE